MPAAASARSARGVTDSGATVVSRRRQLARAAISAACVGIVHRPDQRRVVRALAGYRQMRAFEMQAEEARHVLSRGLAPGRDCRGGDLAACR